MEKTSTGGKVVEMAGNVGVNMSALHDQGLNWPMESVPMVLDVDYLIPVGEHNDVQVRAALTNLSDLFEVLGMKIQVTYPKMSEKQQAAVDRLYKLGVLNQAMITPG